MIPEGTAACRALRSFRTASAILVDDSGQGLGEYGLILGLIAAVCLAIVIVIGNNLSRTLTHVGSSL